MQQQQHWGGSLAMGRLPPSLGVPKERLALTTGLCHQRASSARAKELPGLLPRVPAQPASPSLPGTRDPAEIASKQQTWSWKKKQCCLVFASYPAPCCSPEWLRSPSENGGVKKAPQGGQEAEQLRVLELCSLVLS